MKHFDLQETGMFDCPKARSVREKLHSNIVQGKVNLLVGPTESGKTMMVKQLMRNLKKKVHFITVDTFDDKPVRMGTILSEIVDDLSTEGARRTVRARSKQAVRALGNKLVNEGKPVCVVFDNTPDRLMLDTMNTIKLLMESEFAGHSPLVSFIILCWPEFLDRIKDRKDITHRCHTIKLDANHGWFTYKDRIQYMKDVFGEVITPSARERIAKLDHLPGDLNNYGVKKMEKAQKADYPKLDDKVVTPTLRERYEKLKDQFHDQVSMSKLAKMAGVGKSTVQLAIDSEPDTASTRKVKKAMDSLENGLIGEQSDNNNIKKAS
jgi:energy-coupling factor transporter ATP-binding protein EcfA2